MNAIELLEQQHNEVDELFASLATAGGKGPGKKSIFNKIADALAVHAEIEEKIFYPSVKARQTEDILKHSVEEHMEVKKQIAELLEMDGSEDDFSDKCLKLMEDVQHHVEEERGELFPKVRKLMDESELDDLGEQMEELAEDLKSGGSGMKPRDMVPMEAKEGPPQI